MKTDVMIHADGLSKHFGSVRALEKVSFEVRRGEVVGFLGPNGAGKSTTMRILTCYLSPTTGSAKINGFDIFDDTLEVRRGLGYLPQRAPLYTDMTVIDYLRFAAEIRGLDETAFKKRLDRVVDVCGLAQVLQKDIGTLSHGYRQRVGLGQALIHDPPILILDEPTSDLDPNEKAEVLKYIKEIGRDRTILLSTHNLAEVEEACARAIIISGGRVVADGSLDEIRAKTGRVRYVVKVDQTSAEKGNAPTAAAVQQALTELVSGDKAKFRVASDSSASAAISKVKELPSHEKAHRFELSSPEGTDIRADIFRLIVAKGWTLLELHRDAQTLDAVFRELTRSDRMAARGEAAVESPSDTPDTDDADEESADETTDSDSANNDNESADSNDDEKKD